ncbi:hypothetical protein IQ07DRAFT_644751 [Pyrenochaeta sp. DS3sAY3a]|nr:hypothetical protein IQ07DRAFT_644751 [Pyrenochaeta sp. DS3sAY3a]
MSSPKPTPYRQIRAHTTPTTITVYQAYNTAIASAAVSAQKLNASPKFSVTRMTWIKPSWAWMLYRSGYSYKDKGQERILALHMRRDAFLELLSKSVVASHATGTGTGEAVERDAKGKATLVRVQWDPERSVRLEKLGYRSIQIGVPGALMPLFVEGIERIEDVTERARELKGVLDERGDVGEEELRERGLVLEEGVVEVGEELKRVLRMDWVEGGEGGESE